MIIYSNGTDEIFAWRKKLRKNKTKIIFSWSIQDQILVLFPDRNDTKWKLYFIDFPYLYLQFSWQNSHLYSCLEYIFKWYPRNTLCALYLKKIVCKKLLSSLQTLKSVSVKKSSFSFINFYLVVWFCLCWGVCVSLLLSVCICPPWSVAVPSKKALARAVVV